MKIKYLLLATIAGAIVAADQAVKTYVHTHFELHESINVISDILSITYVRNPGAAFGFLGTSPQFFREIFFLSMPPIALLIILAILRTVTDRDRLTIVSLSMVFGGAIGNYIDRLRFRYVIDFLDFHMSVPLVQRLHGTILSPLLSLVGIGPGREWVYPAFNVADMAIVGGVGALLFVEFRKYRDSRAALAADQAAEKATGKAARPEAAAKTGEKTSQDTGQKPAVEAKAEGSSASTRG
jgi:signal peptidase II